MAFEIAPEKRKIINPQTKGEALSYYPLYDGHGSVIALSDIDGVVTDTYDYTPYGKIRNSTGSTSNPYQYSGERTDSETGFQYLRARYYNTDSGRFTTRDTWVGIDGSPVTLNKYLYGNGNPVRYVDPSGHFSMMSLSTGMKVQAVLRRSLAYVSYAGFVSGVMGVVFGIPIRNAFESPSADILQYEGGHSNTTFSAGFDIVNLTDASEVWYAPFLGTYTNFSLRSFAGKVNKFLGKISVGAAYNLKSADEYQGYFFSMSGQALKLIRPDLNGKYPAKATLFSGTQKDDGTSVYGWLVNIPGTMGSFLDVGLIGAGGSYYPHIFAWDTIINVPFSELGIQMGKANKGYLNILSDILKSSEY